MSGVMDIFSGLEGEHDGSHGVDQSSDLHHAACDHASALEQHGNLLDEPAFLGPMLDADLAATDLDTGPAPEFDLKAWLAQESFSIITDYNPATEQLVLVYDTDLHGAPALRIENAEDSPRSLIFLDDHMVAEVHAKITAADIRLLTA